MDTATTQDRNAASLEVVSRSALLAGPPYKEASTLRQAPAVVVDVLLHLLVAVIVAGSAGGESWSFFLALVAGYVVASFVHRVLLRRWWGVTIGGGLFGLRWIESGTGRRPTLARLAWVWLIGSLVTVLTVLTGG
jgi:hypothetical protein